MILIVNSSFSTGGKVFTTPGFTFSGLSFFASIFADFELSGFFFTDAFLFKGSSTGGATDFGALLLFLRANLTWTLHIPTWEDYLLSEEKSESGAYVACARFFFWRQHRLRFWLHWWGGSNLT